MVREKWGKTSSQVIQGGCQKSGLGSMADLAFTAFMRNQVKL
jgi:hypothetical protein